MPHHPKSSWSAPPPPKKEGSLLGGRVHPSQHNPDETIRSHAWVAMLTALTRSSLLHAIRSTLSPIRLVSVWLASPTVAADARPTRSDSRDALCAATIRYHLSNAQKGAMKADTTGDAIPAPRPTHLITAHSGSHEGKHSGRHNLAQPPRDAAMKGDTAGHTIPAPARPICSNERVPNATV